MGQKIFTILHSKIFPYPNLCINTSQHLDMLSCCSTIFIRHHDVTSIAFLSHEQNISYGYSRLSQRDGSSKILNTFCFLFSNNLQFIRVGIHKMLVRIANRKDPDQSLIWVCAVCLGLFGGQLVFKILEHILLYLEDGG